MDKPLGNEGGEAVTLFRSTPQKYLDHQPHPDTWWSHGPPWPTSVTEYRALTAAQFAALLARLRDARRALEEIRGYAEEIERATEPGDAHECAKVVRALATAARGVG